ncbi:MAG: YitT family protein [Ruminococcaceae bacterium]|nr:YitT family protein [Oscillospiraceae bacterium]
MKIKFSRSEILNFLKNTLLVIVGTIILSFGSAVFIIPFDLVTGGVSGIAIVLHRIIPLDFLTVDLIITIVTWLLFFVGFFVLGKSFALKTLISTIIYPLGISLFMKLSDPSFLNGFFCLQASQYSEISLILATALGGACVGAGCAITFLGGGSTGGVDIISFSICKVFKRLKSSVVIFIVDASIVVFGMFVIGDFVLSLLGIFSALVAAFMVDKVFIGSSKSFIAQIISEEYKAINAEIIKKIDRGSTIVDVVGGYTGENKKMIMVSFTVNQYAEILNVINRNDKNAFVTIHQAHEINGEGWTR